MIKLTAKIDIQLSEAQLTRLIALAVLLLRIFIGAP